MREFGIRLAARAPACSMPPRLLNALSASLGDHDPDSWPAVGAAMLVVASASRSRLYGVTPMTPGPPLAGASRDCSWFLFRPLPNHAPAPR